MVQGPWIGSLEVGKSIPGTGNRRCAAAGGWLLHPSLEACATVAQAELAREVRDGTSMEDKRDYEDYEDEGNYVYIDIMVLDIHQREYLEVVQ